MRRCVGLMLWLAVGVVAPASAVGAQTADYPGGTTVEVQGETFIRGGGGSGGGNQEAGTGGGSQVAGTQTSRAGGLAVTGADVAQLGVMGVALVAGGTVLVRRSRRRHGATSAPAEA